MADGSIRIGVDVEIAKAEKELSNLNKELSKQTNSVAKLESQYRLLQKEKEVTFLGAPLDTTITKLKAQEAELEKLKTEYTQLKATTDYSNAEEVKGLVKKANKLDKFTEEIKNQKQDLAMFSAVKDEPTKKQWSLQFKMDNANAEIDGLNKKEAVQNKQISQT